MKKQRARRRNGGATSLLVLATLLTLVGFCQAMFCAYTKAFVCAELVRLKHHCWLWAGLGTTVLSASTVFLFVGVHQRAVWLVAVHLACVLGLQTACFVLSEALHWHTWMDKGVVDECKGDAENSAADSAFASPSTLLAVRLTAISLDGAGVALSLAATVLTPLLLGCRHHSIDGEADEPADISGNSCRSWSFVRAMSTKGEARPTPTTSTAAGAVCRPPSKYSSSGSKRRRRRRQFKGRRTSVIGHFDASTRALTSRSSSSTPSFAAMDHLTTTPQSAELDDELIEQLLRGRAKSEEVLGEMLFRGPQTVVVRRTPTPEQPPMLTASSTLIGQRRSDVNDGRHKRFSTFGHGDVVVLAGTPPLEDNDTPVGFVRIERGVRSPPPVYEDGRRKRYPDVVTYT